MRETSTLFVGMDVHKDSIDIAVAEDGRSGEVRHWGTVAGDMPAVDRVLKQLGKENKTLRFVYEAGPCGFTLYRHLKARNQECVVISPSMIPRRSGDRIKTDRRDSVSLAKLHRAGELRPIYVPDDHDEAIRDLVRAREDAVVAKRRAKLHVTALLLRSGTRYSGKSAWTLAHRRWLGDITMTEVARQIALREYIETVNDAEARIERLTQALRELVVGWRFEPVITALQGMRGISFVAAATLAAELGDVRRFSKPTELMAYVGMVPSQYSSGPSHRHGSITKTGNSHVRRIIAEAAWAYCRREKVSSELERRQQALPKPIRDISWKAQRRLCGRYRRLSARGKEKQKIIVAIGRELLGFIWAIAREVTEPAR